MAPVGTGADGAGAPVSDGEAALVGTDGRGAVAGITGVGTTKNASINRNISNCIFSLTRLIGSDSVAA